MVRKIISGGQVGVEAAALDLAVKLGIPCSGWTPRDKPSRNRERLQRYQLTETESMGFQQAIDRNIIEADGMLLITRGDKTKKTQYAVNSVLKYSRQLLHIDLTQYSEFEAASLICSWLQMNNIGKLYVTGPVPDEADKIYGVTQKVIETAFYLIFVKVGLHPKGQPMPVSSPTPTDSSHPRTVREAVHRLKSEIALKDRVLLANMQSNELESLRDSLGEYIKQTYGLYADNPDLFRSAAQVGNLENPLPDEACLVILRALWQELHQSHKLRIIK